MEKAVENWDQREDVKNDEKVDGIYEKCHDARWGNVEMLWFLHEGLHMYNTSSPTFFKVLIHDEIVAMEAANQG